ncbi:7-carboxy-7-deazaguanine synthase [Clostridium tepidiprofundi DSM 19306]|uniref:7-carboxy-7-deazaguanine synthase n=1 Tax=Clostridium tepidiprofundi DSM 19306 TaxID=1121338 RepID=A0A151B428_9CLOT|nr:putative 7-carboxy-7-deazaguanine synthase QueE [Clostridium tepidiprofundi]KYH34407.1 7-carboxy-7-deazaguanine synthase [Clostridium tepidiprofundi DSM 19306]
MKYRVVEKFTSINGEGKLSGQLSVFIRFAGCNLNCSYCDTQWANKKDVKYELMTAKEIYEYIKSTNIKNVTLTGGEPLIQDGILELLSVLSKDCELSVEIETNGSVDISLFSGIKFNPPKFTMDYKLASSNMEQYMLVNNFNFLGKKDIVKFVVGNIEDLKRAKYIIEEYDLANKTNVYISPVFGKIYMKDIVEFMKINTMNDVTLQMQLHKIIWDPQKRGV